MTDLKGCSHFQLIIISHNAELHVLCSSSTELDFVSGVSDVELTDSEFGKPSASAIHLNVAQQHHGKKLSPVVEETSGTPSGQWLFRIYSVSYSAVKNLHI